MPPLFSLELKLIGSKVKPAYLLFVEESGGGVGMASISDLIRLPSWPAFPLWRQFSVFLLLLLIIGNIQLYSPIPKHDPPMSPGNSDNRLSKKTCLRPGGEIPEKTTYPN